MNNSVSDRSFYIESEEEDEENEYNKGEDDGDNGDDSDSSNYSNDNRQQSKPDSLNTTWPQSYRQSIDLYSSVPSPSLNFLGTPSLSRLGSSFLSSSLTRRRTPEILPSLAKPLLSTVPDEQQPKQRRSSHSLFPPLTSRRSSLKKVTTDRISSKVSHEIPVSRQSSFGQAVLNGMNVLCGVGILSTAYAVKQGGWAGLSLLFIFGILSFYTGILLHKCLDSQPGLETYPDIGQAAFGTVGRIAISIILYVELYVFLVCANNNQFMPWIANPILIISVEKKEKLSNIYTCKVMISKFCGSQKNGSDNANILLSSSYLYSKARDLCKTKELFIRC